MPQTRADVATPNASKYLRRLCKHWSHRFEVKYDDIRGVVDFGTSRCEMTANESHLLIDLVVAVSEDVARLEAVVAEHLKRVGNDDSLVVEWQRPSQKSLRPGSFVTLSGYCGADPQGSWR